jgi:hypothetical protein
MDALVQAGLRKWPNVPHCHGWLGLDARGRWYLRDEAAQAAGAFPASKGSLIEHKGLVGFIERNYDHDPSGCWFFQNGPQRVYVELEAAPWVWRIEGTQLSGCAGRRTPARSVWLDEHGRLFADTPLGFGLVHTLDTALAADAIDAGVWHTATLPFADMPARFGYVLSPQAGTQ